MGCVATATTHMVQHHLWLQQHGCNNLTSSTSRSCNSTTMWLELSGGVKLQRPNSTNIHGSSAILGNNKWRIRAPQSSESSDHHCDDNHLWPPSSQSAVIVIINFRGPKRLRFPQHGMARMECTVSLSGFLFLSRYAMRGALLHSCVT